MSFPFSRRFEDLDHAEAAADDLNRAAKLAGVAGRFTYAPRLFPVETLPMTRWPWAVARFRTVEGVKALDGWAAVH